MWHVWGTGEVHTVILWAYVKGIDHMEDSAVEGRIILKLVFKMWDEEACTGLTWLRIRVSGGLL
jgi:hypothetical protein